MNYHNITKSDMLNGDGLRVVLWLAGCEHHCKNCQNPITWDPEGGLYFGPEALSEVFEELNKPYISGITFSGGDPLHPANRKEVITLAGTIKVLYPTKTIWLYTGYLWEQIHRLPGIENIDVIVDGKFIEDLADITYPWAGSRNQRVIDVKKSLANDTGATVRYHTDRMEEIHHEDNCGCDAGKCC